MSKSVLKTTLARNSEIHLSYFLLPRIFRVVSSNYLSKICIRIFYYRKWNRAAAGEMNGFALRFIKICIRTFDSQASLLFNIWKVELEESFLSHYPPRQLWN